MPVMRFSPDFGTHSVSRIDCSETSRKVSGIAWLWPTPAAAPLARSSRESFSRYGISLSMWMNHWGVLRKITGFFERHECGYWCFRRPRASRLPALTSASITARLASPFSPLSVMTRFPSKPGASVVKAPFSSTV